MLTSGMMNLEFYNAHARRVLPRACGSAKGI
jgi:hypothetical protein